MNLFLLKDLINIDYANYRFASLSKLIIAYTILGLTSYSVLL